MNLKLIGDTISSVAEAIANVLDVDVIVVDKQLKIIGNTINSFDMVGSDIIGENSYLIENSIIASCMNDNIKKVVIDINSYEKCNMCEHRQSCKLNGLIAIPIRYKEVLVGAIGIMISNRQKGSRFEENLKGITIFLEKMSDLLGSKLASVEQFNKIERINKEIEYIIKNVKDGIVYLDEENKIAYYNNEFKEYFNISDNIKGENIEKVLDHIIIRNYLYNKKNISDEIFVFRNSNVDFKGLISCVNTNLNSDYLGTIITFRKIEETNTVINEILNNKSTIKFNQLICSDVDTKNEMERAKKAAIDSGNILIMGKKGTGKKALAYSIHNFSDRKSNYLLTVDCKFLPRDYYLSELFGIGKSMINPGKFQLADKGTIVFNEIANLPLNIQSDLLSYISKGEIKLEKGITIKDIDVRIIGITKYDLKQRIKKGFFNEELFYRLSTNSFNLKELKNRDKNDFTLFVKHFLDIYTKVFSKSKINIVNEGIEVLFNEEWDENITGLERFIEQMVCNTQKANLSKQDIIEALAHSKQADFNSEKIKTFDEYEKELIANALSMYKGVKNRNEIVADKLGIGRATLYRKISKYNLA